MVAATETFGGAGHTAGPAQVVFTGPGRQVGAVRAHSTVQAANTAPAARAASASSNPALQFLLLLQFKGLGEENLDNISMFRVFPLPFQSHYTATYLKQKY